MVSENKETLRKPYDALFWDTLYYISKTSRVIKRDFRMGGGDKGPMEGWLARDSQQNSEVSQISNKCE